MREYSGMEELNCVYKITFPHSSHISNSSELLQLKSSVVLYTLTEDGSRGGADISENVFLSTLGLNDTQ